MSRRTHKVLLSILALATAAAAAQPPTQRPAHRQEFLAAALALAADRDADYARRRKQLDAYVLAPYLDYAALRRDLRTLDHARAREFLAREKSTQLGAQFRREFLGELARRQDWRGFLAFDDAEAVTDATSRCLRLQARIALGDGDAIRADMLALWPTGDSLPDACDDAIAYARGRGWIGSEQIWQRLRLAADGGNAGLASHLARQLPASERSEGERLAKALGDPERTLIDAKSWSDTATTRHAVAVALKRRARQSIEHAIAHWQALSARFDFADAERAAILHQLALYAAVDYRGDAGDWFARVPAPARDEQLADWQLRAALAKQDWPAVQAVAEGLPAPLSSTARPAYWRARAHEQLGRAEQARAGFRDLAVEANFHGFLAADRVGAPYSICPRELPEDPARLAALKRNTDIARALELHAVGWRTEATRAWDHARLSLDEDDRLQMLHLAVAQDWHDRAVFSLSTGDAMRFYALRFPVAERATIEREAQANGIDPAWVYALIRAESAWQPDARSHANAYGLMQLLPGTGQRMARELGIAWRGTGMLLEPQVNIRLGTRYLAQQAERFDGSPWLASAAYNAGPAPVERWLGERARLPADVFIETIPYKETREYVARVLAFSVIYDWRLHGKARPLSSRLPDPDRRYAGVPAPDQARPVVCAVPAPSPAPATP